MCFFNFLQTCFICPVKQTNPLTSYVWLSVRKRIFPLVRCYHLCFVKRNLNRTRSACSCTQCGILHRTWLPVYLVCVCVSKRTELHSFSFFFKPLHPLYPSICFWNKPFSHGLKSAEEQNRSSVLCVSLQWMFSATWLVCILEVLITYSSAEHGGCQHDVMSDSMQTLVVFTLETSLFQTPREWDLISRSASNLYQNLNIQHSFVC